MQIGIQGETKGLTFKVEGEKVAITLLDNTGKKGPEVLETVNATVEEWGEVTAFIQRQIEKAK